MKPLTEFTYPCTIKHKTIDKNYIFSCTKYETVVRIYESVH